MATNLNISPLQDVAAKNVTHLLAHSWHSWKMSSHHSENYAQLCWALGGTHLKNDPFGSACHIENCGKPESFFWRRPSTHASLD